MTILFYILLFPQADLNLILTLHSAEMMGNSTSVVTGLYPLILTPPRLCHGPGSCISPKSQGGSIPSVNS